jgi:prefoldin alpha subunit
LSSQQQGITLEEAIEQLNLLEGQIKQLQAAAAELEARLLQLSSLESALADLREGSNDALIPLDPKLTVLARGTVKPLEKLIVHAGSNIFVEVGYEKAVDIVRREKAEVSKLLDAYRQELAKLTQYYTALRTAIEQTLAAAQTPQARQARQQ